MSPVDVSSTPGTKSPDDAGAIALRRQALFDLVALCVSEVLSRFWNNCMRECSINGTRSFTAYAPCCSHGMLRRYGAPHKRRTTGLQKMRPRYGQGRQVASDRDASPAPCLQMRRLPRSRLRPAGLAGPPASSTLMSAPVSSSARCKCRRYQQLIPRDLISNFACIKFASVRRRTRSCNDITSPPSGWHLWTGTVSEALISFEIRSACPKCADGPGQT